MIADTLENARNYPGLGPRMDAAFAWLREADLDSLSLGEHPITDGVRAIVQQYETVPEAGRRYEAHREFIDIQFVASGEETMLVRPLASMDTGEPYDPEKDIVFFNATGRGSRIVAPEGTFAIFFPQDAHMPMVMVDSPTAVRKIVLKVAV